MADVIARARAAGDLAYGTPIDLSNCEREPIHIPGQIQSHGVLLALDVETLVVLQASDNTLAWLALPVEQLLGRAVTELLEPERAEELARVMRTETLEDNPLFLFSARVCGAGPFSLIAHTHDGVLLLELEVPQRDSEPRPDFYELIKRSVSRFQAARTVRQFSQLVVEEVRRVSGYDRVMVYQFAPDWSGHVVAESMDTTKGLESYLGLHYPASDIPAQARALFLLNTVRMLVDARAVGARLVPELHPRSGKPLDLSHTFLRGASQMYTEYLNNMGVRATLTLAIAKGDWMWGMLVCHHYATRQIPYDVRAACELLARVVSVQMADKQVQEDDAYRHRISDSYDAIVRSLARHEDLERGLLDCAPNVGAFLDRASVAVITAEGCRLRGEAPSEVELRALVAWLDANQHSEVFSTDALPSLYPPAEAFQATACGVLSVQVSRARSEYVIWMRPELVRTEHWAGDPSKPVETGPFGDRLTPRKSFALWQETVRGRSAPFTSLELEAAARLRTALADTVLVRGEKLTRAAHRSRSLFEVADALSAAQTRDDVMEVVLERGLKATGAQAVFVHQTDEHGRLLEAEGRGAIELVPASWRGLAIEQAAPSQVAAAEGRLVISRGAPGSDAQLLGEEGQRLGPWVALPLGGAASSLGVMTFAWAAPRAFSLEDEEFLRTLAKLCGQALRRSQLADRALKESEDYRSSLVDSLEDHVAVLDPDGVIIEVNEAWRSFSLANATDPSACGIGANYLEECQRVPPGSDDGSARSAYDGIRAVIDGHLEKFGMEYACATQQGRRWFTLRVSRAAGRAPGSVVISHSDVTTIKQTEDRLREALREKDKLVSEVHEQNQRVEEATRLKSEFLANMSHELRTPLNGIIGFSELITDGKAGPISAVQREYLGDVLSSARHLHELINDVLDLTKVESGKLQFHPEPVDVGMLLRDARDILRAVAAKKRISVAAQVDPMLDDVVIDAARFKQVLFNYLSNALKFTPEGGQVQLRLGAEGAERFRLEVEDTGIGIRPEDLPQLFVEFRQLDASKAKRYAGTGLGLALTKRIVEAQGGEVGALSVRGKGSVFFAVLPRRPRSPGMPDERVTHDGDTGSGTPEGPVAPASADKEGTSWTRRRS